MSKVKRNKYRPPGYRVLGDVLAKTEKAIKFYYHGWGLWIPKSALVKVYKGPYTAPGWAIDSAKDHKSAEYGILTLSEHEEEDGR